ncbi:MAG: ribonuclease H-like domain-containing protein [Prevotellaceae bacterium]|jgi:DNA polymerase-3 subunit epsilon|nr:ribonuclease H-like domain-containing protein [Prevotellaceae bacterium]
MKLNLTRPLIFFDLETTGIDTVKDRIVEISYLKVFPDAHEEAKTFRINPEMHIPESATLIHGITDDDVSNCPTFSQIARQIERDFTNCDIAGYNSNRFDMPLLAEEFLRADCDIDIARRKMIDVQVVFHKMEQRTLSAAYKFYCNKDLENAHSAASDTRATYEVLMAQLDRYPKLENTTEFLANFTYYTKNLDFAGRIIENDKGEIVFNFGKYKGIKVLEVFDRDPGYYSWIMNGDFALHTKKVLTSLKLSTFNK